MLAAFGGNLSNTICGENLTTTEEREIQKREFDLQMRNYSKLANCSEAILEACTVPENLHNKTALEKIKLCNVTMKSFTTFTNTCITDDMKKNAKMQCTCWGKATLLKDEIQDLNCKINNEKNKQQ